MDWVGVDGVLITSLWRIQEYNDYNDVTMAYEDGTQVRHTRLSLHQLVQLCNFPIFVRPYNNCKVRSYNNCKVRPYNKCKVRPYNECKVRPYNNFKVIVRWNLTIIVRWNFRKNKLHWINVGSLDIGRHFYVLYSCNWL